MEKYRKIDSFYEDQYDRQTIEILKKLESESTVPLKHPRQVIETSGKSKTPFIIESQYDSLTPFYEQAVSRACHRETDIRQAKWDDEEKDRLVSNYPEPQNIK